MGSKPILIATVVVLEDFKVLLADAQDYFYVPGADVSESSGIELALRRGLMESWGMEVNKTEFIGVVEALFGSDATPFNQKHFVFAAEIEGYAKAWDDHKLLVWVPVSELKGKDIRPKPLADAVIQWLKDKKTFWRPAL